MRRTRAEKGDWIGGLLDEEVGGPRVKGLHLICARLRQEFTGVRVHVCVRAHVCASLLGCVPDSECAGTVPGLSLCMCICMCERTRLC